MCLSRTLYTRNLEIASKNVYHILYIRRLLRKQHSNQTKSKHLLIILTPLNPTYPRNAAPECLPLYWHAHPAFFALILCLKIDGRIGRSRGHGKCLGVILNSIERRGWGVYNYILMYLEKRMPRVPERSNGVCEWSYPMLCVCCNSVRG